MQNNLLAGGQSNPEITNPFFSLSAATQTGPAFFQKFISGLVVLGLVVGSIVLIFVLIVGAIQWISSGGDKEAVGQARKKISNALIGIVISFSVFAIVKLIEYFFGISILTIDIESLIIR